MDIAVIGGGILGASSALHLAERGHDVRLIEQEPSLGAGATGRAAGILSTMTWSDDEYRLIADTRGLIGEVISLAMAAGNLHAKAAWRPYDSITIAAGEGGRARLDDIQDRLERHTEEPERLDWRAAQAEFPGLVFEPGEEVLVAQEDGAIEAGDLLGALQARLADEDVQLTLGERVDARPSDVDVTVVAGGAWTKGLLASWGVALPVQAFRTQLASLAMAGATDLPIVHDLTAGFYTRPESPESMLAGNGTILKPHDPDTYNQAADPEFRESIAGRVVQRFKGGAEASLRRDWAGLCVATPDRHALCGPVPEHDDLFVVTGDNGFGLMRGLALGERLADAVDGEVAPWLSPARFADMEDDFEMREGYG